MISLAELADMRAVAEQSMGDVCEVLGTIDVDDNAGGMTSTPTVLATTICGVSAIGDGDERVIVDRLGWTAGYRIRLPLATVVTPANTLRVNGTRVFEVGVVLVGAANATAKVAICREVG